jgi:hypothetical protein
MARALRMLEWTFPWMFNMFRGRSPQPKPQLTAEERQSRFRENGKAIILTSVVLLLAFAWTRGTFDNFLWRVHLNYTDCAQNGFGATFCGDQLREYKERFGIDR